MRVPMALSEALRLGYCLNFLVRKESILVSRSTLLTCEFLMPVSFLLMFECKLTHSIPGVRVVYL